MWSKLQLQGAWKAVRSPIVKNFRSRYLRERLSTALEFAFERLELIMDTGMLLQRWKLGKTLPTLITINKIEHAVNRDKHGFAKECQIIWTLLPKALAKAFSIQKRDLESKDNIPGERSIVAMSAHMLLHRLFTEEGAITASVRTFEKHCFINY